MEEQKKDPSPKLSKEQAIHALENLTQEPGFVYSLSIMICHDLFLDPEKSADINWHDRLSFQELSFLVGLMVKHQIDISVFPSEHTSKEQIAQTNNLFQKLHEAHNTPFMEKIGELIGKSHEKGEPEESEKEFNELFGSGELMTEPIFYGGSGAYDFQYWEFAPKKFLNDEDWIKSNIGIPVSVMTEISMILKKLHEKKWHELRKSKTFEEFCKNSLSVFCFQSGDLSIYDKNVLVKFVQTFAVSPGTVNQKLDSIGGYNAIDSHPVVSLEEDLFFIPAGFNLAQSIYESPFYWMNADEKYRDTALKHRGEATERIAYELLENVFGNGNVYKNIKVYRNKKEIATDIDVLAIAGNKAVIVQAKSKKLTELSKRGNTEKLKLDFKDAIQNAYDQGLVSRSAIINRSNTLVDSNGNELKLGEFIDEAYIICITTDNYPAVTHQVDIYLKKNRDDPYPLAMNIFDLDIVAFYLKDSFEFLYYLRQRISLSTYYKASSEMALLGAHLRQKLFPRPGVDEEMLDEGFAQLIDANFPAMRGYQPKTSALEKLHHNWKNDKFNQLIAQIKSTRHPGFTDATFYLYDLAGDGADDLIRMIEQTKQKAANDGRLHDFSMIFEKGKSGVTFLCMLDSVEKMNDQLMSLAMARKYKTKADVWLALGSTTGSKNFVDAIAFNKDPWTEDKELEELTKVALKKSKPMNPAGKKMGRNERCFCGSGKKFKDCHGK